MNVTPYSIAERYIGIHELAGPKDHPLIQWWHSLCSAGADLSIHDEVAWCSAFVNGIMWSLRLPRSKSAAARSWLAVGEAVALEDAKIGHDIVVFWRGRSKDGWQGHVGFYSGHDDKAVHVLGGNQGNVVSVEPYDRARLLGVRRIG